MKRDGVDDDDDILSLLLRGFRPKYGIRIFKIWGPSNNVVPGGSRNPERCYDAKKGTNKLDRGKASISHICPWFYAPPRHFLWFPAQNKMLSNIGSHGETIVHCPSEPTIAPSSVRPQGGDVVVCCSFPYRNRIHGVRAFKLRLIPVSFICYFPLFLRCQHVQFGS